VNIVKSLSLLKSTLPGISNWLITTRPKELQYYKDILIHADIGVHEQAIAILQHYVPIGSTVLDLGAGAGAFSKRLFDSGYQVNALDIDAAKWIPKEIPFYKLDVDLGIAASLSHQFDAVCCMEVIEHVENPWNLLREIDEILKPGGRLLLSTPNITSFLSRLIFLQTGEFHQFSKADLAYGHISPITTFEMLTIAERVGFTILEIRPGGYLPIFDLSSLRPAALASNILRGIAYLLARGHKHGWCLFFVMEKSR
jgi:2-polyprenyl-3-methyl-5-hydroxy-6-metoxy-1,4-benzoquinol methylase